MRIAVTTSLVPEARGGPFVFWDGLEDAFARAASLGFDGVEIFPPSAGALVGNLLGDLVAKHRLRVAAVGTGGGWITRRLTLTSADPETRAKARTFIGEIIDVAANYSAPAIIGSMQGRADGGVSRDQALAWLAEALEELGEQASRRGVPLLYEPLNRYETNLFNRLVDTAGWLHTLRTRNVRLLADLFHMNIDEADTPAALRESGKLIGHVHFADSNRRAMGFGQTNSKPIFAALKEIGYQGFLSAEILPLPDPATAATQTMKAFKKGTSD